MPLLRVLAGTSPTSLVPITDFVNTNTPHFISSDVFEGQVVVNIKGFTNSEGRLRDTEYFRREDRKGITWSIQVQGALLGVHFGLLPRLHMFRLRVTMDLYFLKAPEWIRANHAGL